MLIDCAWPPPLLLLLPPPPLLLLLLLPLPLPLRMLRR
jgi:hypothetical protein